MRRFVVGDHLLCDVVLCEVLLCDVVLCDYKYVRPIDTMMMMMTIMLTTIMT